MKNSNLKWENLKWGDLATLEYGKGLREYSNENAEYPVFGTNGQIGWHDKYLCPFPGIIVGRKGAYRGIHFSDKPFFVIDTAFYLKPKTEFNIKWAYYQLVDFDINKLDSGSAIPSTSREAFYQIPVRFPPPSTQHKIASIISTYDNLIENNTRRIEILEEMARMIYQEWFVKFRFPGHEKVKMVDSPLGKIPKGWAASKLGEVIELAYGKGLTADKRVQGNVPVFGSAGVVGYHNESLVSGPGVVVGRKGNVGSVFWSDDDFYPIDTVFYVKTSLSLPYVYYNLQNQNFINTDAAVPGLSRNLAYLNPFLVPDFGTLQAFEEFIEPALGQVKNLSEKNANLRQTRDLLLPKLISGEVDVSELGIAVPEEVAA